MQTNHTNRPDIQTDRQTGRQTCRHTQTDKCAGRQRQTLMQTRHRHAAGQVDRQTYIQTKQTVPHKQTDKHADRHVDIDRQTDVQADRDRHNTDKI